MLRKSFNIFVEKKLFETPVSPQKHRCFVPIQNPKYRSGAQNAGNLGWDMWNVIYTPGNVAKHSMEHRHKLRRILPNVPRISSSFLYSSFNR